MLRALIIWILMLLFVFSVTGRPAGSRTVRSTDINQSSAATGTLAGSRTVRSTGTAQPSAATGMLAGTVADLLPDTIPYRSSLLKSAGQLPEGVTVATRIDTVITVVINELMAINAGIVKDAFGDDDDWFEIYNYGEEPVLVNNLRFSDNPSKPAKWQIDSEEPHYLEPGGYMIFWADDEGWEGAFHTNFSLSGDGEFLGIFDRDGNVIDQLITPQQTADVSYGRTMGAGLDWYYFAVPTPGAENDMEEYQGLLPMPQSDRKGGLCSEPFQLSLFYTPIESELRYTTDCSDPVSTSPLYDSPLHIDQTTIVKARLFREGYLAGPVLTLSFLFEEDSYDNPVLSVVTDEGDLWGTGGLLTTRSSTMEIPGHMEFFNGQEAVFSAGAGVQLHAVSSSNPVSMRLYARSRYGESWFEHPFFGDEAPGRFKRLVLRNAGNDLFDNTSRKSHMRDPMVQEIARHSNKNPMCSAAQPVNLFLNGKYHGLLNMRERIDKYYISEHTGETEDFDLLEMSFGYSANRHPIEGSFDAWHDLLALADTTGDLTVDDDFRAVAEQVDLENFTDYWITEVFVGNYDWLSNNKKWWKPDDGPWQWIYWDTDHGLGFRYLNYGDVEWNTLEWSLTFSDRAWSSGYNNILIRNLLKNPTYRVRFIKRFNTLLNTRFTYRETAPLLQSMKARYQNDIALHAERWNKGSDNWSGACYIIDQYLQQRPAHVMDHLQDFFELDDPVPVTFRVFPSGGGTIYWDDERVTGDTHTGQYFPGFSYGLKAVPAPGFSLESLVVNSQPAQHDTVTITGPATVEAWFKPLGLAVPLQLTEVYYNNREEYDSGDWIEFYHYGDGPLNLSGAQIRSGTGDTLFTFGDNAVVSSNTWFVVAESEADFIAVFPPTGETLKGAAPNSAAEVAAGSADSEVEASAAAIVSGSAASLYPMVFGGLTGGIPADIAFRLVSAEGEDYLVPEPMSAPGWPVISGEGYSLQLKDPSAVIQDPRNWRISQTIYGSPGLPNEQTRHFHPPEGRDTVVSNHARVTLELPSIEFYSDPDGHALTHIAVILTDGPGELLLGGEPVPGNMLGAPADLSFVPDGPAGEATTVLYKFIDRSGQPSMLHEIRFEDVTGTRGMVTGGLSRYPNPARETCIFVFDRPVTEPCTVSLLDLTGKTVLHTHHPAPGTRLEINVREVPAGIYLFRLRSGQQHWQGKIVVATR